MHEISFGVKSALKLKQVFFFRRKNSDHLVQIFMPRNGEFIDCASLLYQKVKSSNQNLKLE